MFSLPSLDLSGGFDILPLIEGGKGISVSNGESAGAWAAAGGVGTFSAVNADRFDENGHLIPVVYKGKTRAERHLELIQFAIQGGITQAKIAFERSNQQGRIHMNVLWEMGAVEPILHGILSQTKGLIHGVTCGAGMPYKLAEICAHYGVYYYPIVSSARAFRILWKRAFSKSKEWLGGVVYEDPWLAGGHNGLSNNEDPNQPQSPYGRVADLRRVLAEFQLDETPIIMAGGIWCLKEWGMWIHNPDIGPVAFQFGTRPLLTVESPLSKEWKNKLLTLKEGDISLNKFSPTGFYSSAVRNDFLKDLEERSKRQIAFSVEPAGDHCEPFYVGARKRTVYLNKQDLEAANAWVNQGYTSSMRTPDSTLIFVTSNQEREIVQDQIDCMGCLSACKFSNWAQNEAKTTGQKPDPRSFCIQKTLQDISHNGSVENNLMFAGHQAYRFAQDPFYANGFIPTVAQLIHRIKMGE
jgi:nitronate monooxygenase